MTPVIEVTGLTKRYGGQAVVDGISFGVEQGEIFGILGPNGAGKTTAVECMEGLRRRDAGQVRILGLDPRTDGHQLHQRIGVQLQETQLPEKLKVHEALEMYASFYPDPADWRGLLERWGLTSKSGTAFAKLSGGQKQRLFIALALVGNPQVVFLDELTAGLDPGARRATWDLISQVRDGGVTVVLVSHFMDEVEELCDRVAILHRGRIAALNTPAGLVDFTATNNLDSAYVALVGRTMDASEGKIMNGFKKLAFIETRLFLREKVATLAVFALPVALVIGFGLIPGFGQPQKGLSDQIGTEYIAAIGVAIVLATLGLNGVPMVIAQYRERGILRRLAVTPVRPLTLLIAKLTVWAAAAVLSVALVIAVVRFAFHVPAPVAPGWFIVSLVLGIAALFAVGMLVAAVTPNARTATGIGMVLFFPNMFFAGIYFPTEEMSPMMRQIGNFTPLGAAVHALRDSWMGLDPRLEYLGIMAAWALVGGAVAARFFRWEQA